MKAFTPKDNIIIIFLLFFACHTKAQTESITPSIAPQNFAADQQVTITYDVTATVLANLDAAYIWMWMPDGVDAPSNINPASSNASQTAPAAFIKSESGGQVSFSITLTPTDFMGLSVNEITELGMLLKGNDWSDGQTTDHVLSLQSGGGNCNNQAKAAINPIIDPLFFRPDDAITITYDVSSYPCLAALDDAYIWIWLEDYTGDNLRIPTNINPSFTNSAATAPARFTKKQSGDQTLFTITLKPTDFLQGVNSNAIQRIGMLLKGNDWSDGQTEDYTAQVAEEGFSVFIQSPISSQLFVDSNDVISMQVFASESATFTLTLNNTPVNTQKDITTYVYDHTVVQTSGAVCLNLHVTNGIEEKNINFQYAVDPIPIEQVRPEGITDGTNYHSDDYTRATLSLLAPNKDFVYMIGTFNDWQLSDEYLMKKDGERFWLEIKNLTPGKEYIFQYFVDGKIRMADPYAHKISSQFDDGQILSEKRYPELMPYPFGKTTESASYLQTKQQPYQWQVNNFDPPDKADLVIYELLIRDFTDERTYQAVADRLDYLQALGINALELMPVMEFEGNISWGYNPSFMLAPDKFYGTENVLKKLIDQAHARGIAVILDITLNHSFGRGSLVRLYNQGLYGAPTSDNIWLNSSPKHDFNVGYDFNHESAYTKKYVDRVNRFWLKEYRVDGFRFDLSKGFTQRNTLGNVELWGRFDPTRIAILQRMADSIWAYKPNTYVILEHFADNNEEIVLSDYGMMLWGNANHDFRNAAKGNPSNIGWSYYGQRGWSHPHLVSYMESHDEERLAWDVLLSGKKTDDYNARDTATALDRIKLCAAFFFTVPSAKMLWQFGELGYDIELNDNRLAIKPTRWEYLEEPKHKALYYVFSSLIKLKTSHAAFKEGDFSWQPSGPYKWIKIVHNDLNISIMGNFGTVDQRVAAEFVKVGTWHNYFSQESINVDDPNIEILLRPGEFHIFTDKPIDNFLNDTVPVSYNNIITGVEDNLVSQQITVYPNPVQNELTISRSALPPGKNATITLYNLLGKKVMTLAPKNTTEQKSIKINLNYIASGTYILKYTDEHTVAFTRIVKQ